MLKLIRWLRRCIKQGSFRKAYDEYNDLCENIYHEVFMLKQRGYMINLHSVYDYYRNGLLNGHITIEHNGDPIGWFDVEHVRGRWKVREFEYYISQNYHNHTGDPDDYAVGQVHTEDLVLDMECDDDHVAKLMAALISEFEFTEQEIRNETGTWKCVDKLKRWSV